MSSIYNILNVSPEASLREIKKAYSVLLKKCDQEAEPDRFQEIREAYEQASLHARQREPGENLPRPISLGREAESIQEQIRIINQQVSQVDWENATSPAEEEENQRSTPILSPAEEVMKALETDYRNDPDSRPMGLLQHYASSDKLLALQNRENFEQLLLVWIFEPHLKTDWLDAATKLFSWDTANGHLSEWRPDLVWRLKRHRELLYLIETIPEMKQGITDGKYYYELQAEQDLQGIVSPVPSSVLNSLARLLVNLDNTYPKEASERFGEKIVYWRRIVDDERLRLAQAHPVIQKNQRITIHPLLVWVILAMIIKAAGVIIDFFSPPAPPPSLPVLITPQTQIPADTDKR